MLVVGIVLAAEEKGELRVVFLFLLRHLFELGAISGDKLGEFVNDVPQLLL